MLQRSSLRADSAPVLAPRSSRVTRYAPCGRCARTDAASWMTMRAARADLGTPLLAAAEIAPARRHLPLKHPGGVRAARHPCLGEGGPGWAGARLWEAEEHSIPGRARSAHRGLTCRVCSSAAPAGRVASYAAGPGMRAPQGSRRAAATLPSKRPSPPGPAFACANLNPQSSHRERQQRANARHTPSSCTDQTGITRYRARPPAQAQHLGDDR